MAMNFQVTFDAREPHALAEWWAETLDWSVEPSNPDFIRDMVTQGYATQDDTTTHRGVLVWKVGAAIRHPDPDAAPGGRILFQLVPEDKTVKNRVHLDVRPGDEDREAVVARLTARGATVLHHGQQGPSTWTTLADPEGNEFCVG
jgi:glyoxalase superfamily protein